MIARFLLASALLCATEGPPEPVAPQRPADARPVLRVQPGTAKPGDPVLVVVSEATGTPEGTLADRPLHFYSYADHYEAIAALPVEQALGTFAVKIRLPGADGGAFDLEASVDVVEPNYPRKELQVDRKYMSPSAAEKRRNAADQAAFIRARRQPFGPRLYQGNFHWPRTAVITAPFGDLRMFNGEKKSQHYGTDLDGNVGDPVTAANDGVVVMTRDCFSTGNTVMISHGGGLFTSYFHLSRIDVKEGEQVKQDQPIGLVGKTGRVTGPHLHWSVHADGIYVNGATLLQLDFSQ